MSLHIPARIGNSISLASRTNYTWRSIAPQRYIHPNSLPRCSCSISSSTISSFRKSTTVSENSSPPESEEESTSFECLGLSHSLLLRMNSIGLTSPTQVQLAAIPQLLKGQDAAVQSYTGSGKTLSYLLPILSSVGPFRHPGTEPPQTSKSSGQSGVEAVVVAPSRELAMQIVREAEKILGPEYKRLVQQLIGGANPDRQEDAMKKNKPAIVVGTPGRIAELSRAGKLQTHGCRMLVLDEADALLSNKYRLDMLRILEHVGVSKSSQKDMAGIDARRRKERQTVFVSATMPPALLEAATKWGSKPVLVRAQESKVSQEEIKSDGAVNASPPRSVLEGVKDSLPPNLDHRFIVAPARHRTDVLRKCVNALGARSVIVFMNYGKRLKDTEYKLEARSMLSGTLHGGMDKVARANVLSAFRQGKLRVLVVSEVAARGLDVMECDLVVNLELPTDGSHYAHRAGRTGRLGRGGTVITICEEAESFVVDKFAKNLGIKIERAEVVEGKLVDYEGRMKY